MKYCEKIMNNFFGVHMELGEIDIKVGHGITCFFIVEHTEDSVFIEKQARQLLVARCKEFVFYGKHKSKWNTGVELEDIKIKPKLTEECAVFTSSCETLEDFVDKIYWRVSERTFVPHDYYLIYDDRHIYEKVIATLKNGKGKSC